MLPLPCSTHTGAMFSDECSLSKAAEIVDLAVISVGLLKKLRDNVTDEQWDSIIDNQDMDELITSLMDLEFSIEEE